MVSPLPPVSRSKAFGGFGQSPIPTPVINRENTKDEREALLQSTQALFCSVGYSGHIQSVSRTWCDKIGVTQTEAVGVSFLQFVQEEEGELCRDEFRCLLTGNPPRDWAARLNCADGSVYWMNLKPSINRDAGVIYILATDITVHRGTEQGFPDPNLILDQVGQGVLVADAGWAPVK
jgi:PAS domain S-box-containing protein